MTNPTTYTGSCHCGAVRYHVNATIESVIACNCSMCQRRGSLLTFVPAAAFTLEAGGDNLTDYQFNKHVIHHEFCKTCGIASFARGDSANGPTVAINTRCLDGVSADTFPVNNYDGRSA